MEPVAELRSFSLSIIACLFFRSGLDMSPHLLGDAANQISAETPPLYDLHAVVYHYGNSYIGHYTNTAKAPSSEGLGKDYSE
jgi:hypothetical protein